MFCTKCGKKIDYDAKVCNECAAKEAAASQSSGSSFAPSVGPQSTANTVYATAQITADTVDAQVTDGETKPAGSRKFGLPKALVAAIVGVVGDAISSINVTISDVFSFVSGVFTFGGEEEIGSAMGVAGVLISVLFGILTLAMGVVAMVFGIISIKAFKTHKRETGVAPVATLVLGIVGLVSGISCVIFSCELFITLIISAVAELVSGTVIGGSAFGPDSF